MRTSNFHSRSAFALGGLALALALGACAIKESTSDDGSGTGLVISVKDSAKVNLDFSDPGKTVFMDSGEFDLVKTRERMKEKGLNPDSVRISGIEVSYSDSAKSFLEANKGVKFVLRMYTRENDTGARLLTLETPTIDSGAVKILGFDPDQTLFVLNQDIFGSPEGWPGLLSSIRDTTKTKVMAIAELTLQDPLKSPGSLRLNMVVTVAGKN